MTTCNTKDIYQISVIKDKIYKTPYYNINIAKEKENIQNICKTYGWPDITEPSKIIPDNSSIKNFLESIVKVSSNADKSQCFSSGNTMEFTTKKYKCYLSKRCEGKTVKSFRNIDYTCHELSSEAKGSYVNDDAKNTNCNNQLIDNLLPYADKNSMKLSQNINGHIRCDEGYVAKGLVKNDKLQGLAPWVCNSNSLTWGSVSGAKVTDKWLGECVKDNCPDITIHNSNKEWDVIHGTLGDEKIIHCNDGYSFNHDLLHQGGKIHCNYVPKKENQSFETKNEMEWFIKDDYLENICNKYNTKQSCEGTDEKSIPKYNPYDHLHGPKGKSDKDKHKANNKDIPIGCVWSPSNNSTISGIKINKPGECHFRKKVDINNKVEPICKALNCPLSNVPHSNRSKFGLPGPTHGKHIGGDCVKADGTIYKNIKTAQDCKCYQHKSCNTCTYDHNCGWCGGGPGGSGVCSISKYLNEVDCEKNNGTWSKPGCYGKGTEETICKKSISNKSIILQKGGGTCLDDNGFPRKDWKEKAYKNRTIDNCENENECINSSGIITPLDTTILESRKETILSKFSPTDTDKKKLQLINIKSLDKKERCYLNNNKWDTSLIGEINNTTYSCYYKNNYIKQDLSNFPIGFTKSGADAFISIAPWYCKDTSKNNTGVCYKEPNRTSCKSKGCEVVENDFDDHLIHWTSSKSPGAERGLANGNYADTVYISGEKDKCFIWKDTNNYKLSSKKGIPLNKGDSEKIKFAISDIESGKYIKNLKYVGTDNNLKTKLKNKTVTIDTNNLPVECRMQYINRNKSYNNSYNLPENKNKQINNIQKGTKTCLDGHIDEKSKCIDSKGETDTSSFSSNTWKNINSITYNKEQSKKFCNSTDFDIEGTISNYNKKKWVKCGDIQNQFQCESLNKKLKGVDTVHYGKICNDKGKRKNVPLKLLCEEQKGIWKRNYEGEWKCYDKENILINSKCTDFSSNTCIIDVPETTGDSMMKNICSKWSQPGLNSDIEFVHHENTYERENKKKAGGICKKGLLNSDKKPVKTKGECEYNNFNFKKKYTFNNSSFCVNKGDENNEPDESLNWTGGNVKSDKQNNWTSECSSTILSTCQVNCNEKYGGGGDYVCSYNNHSNETCEILDKRIKKAKTKKELDAIEDQCNSKINCEFKNKRCSNIPTNKIKGQMEWKGQRCYLLNNDAFSHGIYNYPELDKFLPPFVRFLILFLIFLLIIGLLYKTGITKITASAIVTIIYTILSNAVKGIKKIGVDLIVGIYTIINDIIDGLKTGSYLKWPSIIYSKWKHIMISLVGFCVISYIITDNKREFSLHYLLSPWDLLTKGYSDIKEEADEVDKDIVDQVS